MLVYQVHRPGNQPLNSPPILTLFLVAIIVELIYFYACFLKCFKLKRIMREKVKYFSKLKRPRPI